MDRAQLLMRTRAFDWNLQALAAGYEELSETVQGEVAGGNTQFDPDGTIVRRLLVIAIGIPQLRSGARQP